jgi:hypothetical protein
MHKEVNSLRADLRAVPELGLRRPASLALSLMDPVHPRRVRAEAFVQSVFFKAYRARLHSFYPLLIGITYPGGDYAAVAGIRPAGAEPLFSEHYLDVPVETLLGTERQRIVEIGNLAPASAGQARWLIATLTAFLTGAGFTHVVFTAVPRLHNAFSRMGLPLARHTDALRERLPAAQQQDWGSYYESRPAVYSGDIRVGERAFSNILAAAPELHDIYRRALEAGRGFAQNTTPSLHEQNYPFA